MNLLKKYLSSRKLIIIFCLLYFFLRIIALDQMFLSPDERDLALTGYSIAKVGKDLFGNKLPLNFERISPNAPIIPIYYDALWWKLSLVKNVFNARLAFIIPATLLPILVWELVFILTKKKNISYLTTIIFSLSPWIFNMSRMGLEINLALPLLILAIILQLKNKKIFSYIFYGLAFFSYQGFRPLTICIPLYFEIYSYLLKEEKTKESFISAIKYILWFFVLFGISLLIEKNFGKRSSNEIIFLNPARLLNEVDFLRSISTAPTIIKGVFDNKFLLSLDYSVINLFKGLDFSYLFRLGDYLQEYSNGVTGQFISIFSIFLILGIINLFKKKLNYWFLAGLTIVGLLPSIVNVYSLTFSIRSCLSAIGLSFLIGLGILYAYEIISKIKNPWRFFMTAIIVFLIFFQTISFFYHYFFTRYFLYSELFYERERNISLFLSKSKEKFTVQSSRPYQTFMSYLFMSDIKNSDFKDLSLMLKNNFTDYSFNGNYFMDCQGGTLVPQDFHKLILSDQCIPDNVQKDIEKLKGVRRIYYSSFVPYKFIKRTAYFIF